MIRTVVGVATTLGRKAYAPLQVTDAQLADFGRDWAEWTVRESLIELCRQHGYPDPTTIVYLWSDRDTPQVTLPDGEVVRLDDEWWASLFD